MRVVMLSGPIGAGKTTVARELLSLAAAPTCYLEGDTFWSLFVKPEAKQRHERFRLIMRSMTAAAVPLARGGYEVLLDFSFPLDFLDTARKILKEIPLDLVILRPSLPVCVQRAAEREAGRIPDYSRYGDFYAMFEGRPQNEISDDALDARSAALRIRQGLDTGLFRVS
ncbi:MAG TPA: AAA family ATPase [Acidobacteriaceae bacterium]|jgi:chloramphenicol 3-O-phosphotransferase|nr:AAA family ATPase [Acidobacteriaceae bacterium]